MYQADVPSYLLPKVVGFLMLPAMGALTTKLAAPAVENVAPKLNPTHVSAVVGALAYGALAYGCYKASESDLSPTLQATFRGGMWGAALSAAFVAASPALSEPGPTVVSGTNPQVDKVFNLLTAQAAGAVALKRSRALAAR